MAETIKELEMINVALIEPHPDNPRKEIGDIREMTDSIKQNGIMQNLTVMRRGSRYQLLIGHRRFAAAKAAGLTEVPCKILTGLSRNEQISIMLEENMQRTDLTVLEQAQGFQMMLDLGDTIEDVANKSGFSKRTVQHRVNIAKLDPDVVKEKTGTDGMQLSIMDFMELERLKSIEDRNEVLKKAKFSYQIKGFVDAKVNEIERKERIEAIRKQCEEIGMVTVPEEYEKTRYSSKWNRSYIPDTTDPYKLPKGFPYYTIDEYGIYFIKEAGKEERPKLTPKQEKEEEKKKRKADIANKINELRDQMSNSIIDHFRKTKCKDLTGIDQEAVWRFILECSGYVNVDMLQVGIEDVLGMDDTDQDVADEIEDIIDNASVTEQMLFVAIHNLLDGGIMKAVRPAYQWEHGVIRTDNESMGKVFSAIAKILEPNGWTWPNDEVERMFRKEHEFFEEEEEE